MARGGVLATVARMWLIRAAFLLGVSHCRLAHLTTAAGQSKMKARGKGKREDIV